MKRRISEIRLAIGKAIRWWWIRSDSMTIHLARRRPGAVGTAQYTSIHTEKEHAIERLKRDGDVLTYDVTVEDPDALSKPWVLGTRRIRHSAAGMEVPGVDALTENICVPTENIVLPNPEDKDLKLRCGYRCDTGTGGSKAKY